MALTQEQVSQLYVALFGRASEGEGNQNWINQNKAMGETADLMLATDAAKDYYGSSMNSNDAFIKFVYLNTFGKSYEDDKAGIDAWVAYLNDSGKSRGEVVAEMIVEAVDPKNAGAAQDLFNNKVEVSNYMAENVYNNPADWETSTAFKSNAKPAGALNVTSDPESVTAAEKKIDAAAAAASKGQDIYLKVTQDDLKGTDKNDTFKAYIFDNQNTAQSGDMIDGGAGIDRLEADIGNSQKFALSLHTTSVEQFAVRAQADNTNDSNDNNMDNNVQIDAERMDGTNWYESNNSRADVVIEDVRIKREEAYNSDSNQITKDITVAMVSTDAGDVDLDVYFDQHSLVAQDGQTKNSITLSVSNQVEATDFDAAKPLDNIPYTDVTFLVNGSAVKLNLDLTNVETYDQMWTAIQNAFNLAKAGAYSSLLANVTITRSEGTDDFTSKDGINRVADEYVLNIENGTITPAVTGWNAAGGLPSTNAFGANVSQGDSSTTSNLITSTIVLDDVGRGSMGGDLVIGGMSTGDTSTSKGVEQFDIFVDRNSKLQNITSTANTLKEVYVKNRDHFADNNTTAVGSLTVTGSINNDGAVVPDDETGVDTTTTIDAYGFNDVRVFDASEMKGSVNITAILSKDVVEKYMNLGDTASDNSADNAEFTYKLGTAADKLELTIAKDNLAAAGTTTREDFSLSIAGNGGNDIITTKIGDGAGNDGTAWYENSKINANLAVDGGEGNDTITTKGAGNFKINAGSGNDTVYTDNIGIDTSAATWVVNTANTTTATHLTNLQSGNGDINTAGGVQTKAFLVNGKLTVTLSDSASAAAGASNNGYEVVVDVPTTNYVVTALQLNQAIKTAINGDAVLSKLLVAKDGPAGTLVITSLIDGEFAANDLTMVVSSTAATTTQEATVLAAYKTFTNNVNSVIADANAASTATVTALNALHGVNGSILASTGVTATPEVSVVTLSDLAAGETYSFDGVTYTAGIGGATAAQLSAVINSGVVDANITTITGTLQTTTVTVTATTATYTATTNGDKVNLTVGGTDATPATVAITDGTGIAAVGTASTVATDNTVTLGAGDDVAVLSTSTASNDTLVFSGSFGKDTIVNFVAGAGAGADKLDFTAYLTTQKLVTGLTSTIAVNFNADDTVAVDANSVTILTTFVQGNGADGIANTADDHTFAGLTADNLLSSIKADGLTTNNYASLVDGTFNASALPVGIIGTTYKSIVMIENDKNDGEYKVFELTANATDFTAATLLGTLDFGDSLALVEANNLVLA